MKIAGADREIERIGAVVETPFRVKGTAKAFRILSSGLYRDKIRAIVRELSCNAFDAHVEAGHPERPFDIHLPNILEPVFRIRDYGLGLLHEDLTTIYTTYFESTKTGSNDLIGGLGLGSKAPFSYVDSFTVTSRHQGEKRSYTLFISDDGCPVVAQMGETEATSEESGLEVIIPVDKPSDFSEFSRKASTVLAYFDPTPHVTGVADFKIDRPGVVLEGVGFRVTASGGPVAVMGRIGYPISASDLRFFSFPDAGLAAGARDLLSAHVEIDFPIGSLDITAGREELSYDKATVQVIAEAIDRVYKDLRTLVQSQFDACQTEVEARRLYGTFERSSDIFYTLASAGKFTWTDRSGMAVPIENSMLRYVNETGGNVQVGMLRLNSKGNPSRPVWSTIAPKGSTYFASSGLFYLDDLPKGGGARAQAHWRERKTTSAYLIPNDPAFVAGLTTAFDGLVLIPASTLPRILSNRPRSKTMFRQFAGKRGETVQVEVDIDDDTTTRHYVVYRSGSYFIDGVTGGFYSRDTFLDRWENRHLLPAAKTIDLYLVPSSIAHKIAGKAHWQPVLPLLHQCAEARLAELVSDAVFAKHRAVDDLKAARTHATTFADLFANTKLAPTHPVAALAKTIAQFRMIPTSRSSTIDRICKAYGLSLESTRDKTLIDAFDQILACYPMIEVLIEGYGRSQPKSLARSEEYIALVDSLTFTVKSEAA